MNISGMIKCAVENCPNYFHRKCTGKMTESLPEAVKEQI
jgi:hypothetical protein